MKSHQWEDPRNSHKEDSDTFRYRRELWLRSMNADGERRFVVATIGFTDEDHTTFDYYEVLVAGVVEGICTHEKFPLPDRWKGKPNTPYRLRECKKYVTTVARMTPDTFFNKHEY